MANHMRTSSSGEKTPEASSVDLKNISTLRAGQGAQIPQSPRQADNTPEPPNRKTVIILVLTAIVALTALLLFVALQALRVNLQASSQSRLNPPMLTRNSRMSRQLTVPLPSTV